MKKSKVSAPTEIKNFVVVMGAMKSGTTTLYHYLAQHPQIAKSRRKEPNFFGLRQQWKKGPAPYLKLWPQFDPATHRYALEASTHYTKGKTGQVAKRMRRFGAESGAEFRCLYILRNPIDRIESQLAHNIAKGRIPFETAEPPEHAVEVSHYARQLDAFSASFGDARILILDFEELKAAPAATLERCVAFLELDPFGFAPIPPKNVRKTANRANEFRLDAAQRAALADRLRPDALALRARYGVDVSGWGFAPSAEGPDGAVATPPPEAATTAKTAAKKAATQTRTKAGRIPEIERFAAVIGAMKSGTSTLFDYLGQHPELAKSRHKEVNFFSGANWRQGRDYYLRQWPGFDPARHRYALEASPQYAKKPRAAQRMRDFGAEFRYLFIARNPVDRIESHLAHNIAGGRLPFEVGLDHKMVATALQASRYAAALDAFRATLGDPKLLILDFDELKRAPLALAERAAGFLELDPSFRFSAISPVNVRKTANRADEFRLTPEQREALAAALRDDVTAFRDRHGFDVGGWGIV